MIDIDKGNHKQGGDKDEVYHCRQTAAESRPAGQRKKAAEQFDNRVSYGDRGFAFPAAPAQQHVADQGNIVIPVNGGIANRAC